jgi:hypothetical protein
MDLGKFTATFSTPMIDEPHETYIEYHLRELGVLTPTVRSGSPSAIDEQAQHIRFATSADETRRFEI